MECTITTVICDSPEGILLLDKAKKLSKGKSTVSTNKRQANEPETKRPRRIEEEETSTETEPLQDERMEISEEIESNRSFEKDFGNETDTLDSFEAVPINDEKGSETTLLGQSSIVGFMQSTRKQDTTSIKLIDAENENPVGTDVTSKQPTAKDIALEVVSLTKEMKVTDEIDSANLLDAHPIAADLDEWKRISNITELANKVPLIFSPRGNGGKCHQV